MKEMTELKANKKYGYLCEVEGEKIFVVVGENIAKSMEISYALDKLEEYCELKYGVEDASDYSFGCMATDCSIVILEEK